MAGVKKRKRKMKPPPPEVYQFEIADWEMSYSIGVQRNRRPIEPGAYREWNSLILLGKILYPIIKNASKVMINLMPEPKMDDHWTENPTISTDSSDGFMQTLRDGETFHLFCRVPSSAFHTIYMAAAFEKIKRVNVYGDRLRWGQGSAYNVGLSTKIEDD